MALSNKFGSLVLTTGNKSEIAVGYCTLYGICAAVSLSLATCQRPWSTASHASPTNEPLSKVVPPQSPKTRFTKPPSAELRPDQKDTDSLPGTTVLDAILNPIENYRAVPEIAAQLNISEDLVRDIVAKSITTIQMPAGRTRLAHHPEGLRSRPPLPHRSQVH